VLMDECVVVCLRVLDDRQTMVPSGQACSPPSQDREYNMPLECGLLASLFENLSCSPHVSPCERPRVLDMGCVC
jgi:hypothetical protein